jgi:hypothetical protein
MFSQAPPWAEHRNDGPTGLIRSTDTGREWLVRVGRWNCPPEHDVVLDGEGAEAFGAVIRAGVQ